MSVSTDAAKAAIVCFLAVHSAASAVAETEVSLAADTTHGQYGYDTATNTTALTASAAWRFDRLMFYAEIPYIWVDGPAAASSSPFLGNAAGSRHFSGSGSRGFRWADTVPETPPRDGLGDAVVGAALRLTPDQTASRLSIIAGATLPTGDETRGLGTGSSDVSLGIAGEYDIGRATLFSNAGFVFAENADGGSRNWKALAAEVRDDFAFASIGASYLFADDQSAALFVSWNAASYEFEEDTFLAGLSTSWPLTDAILFEMSGAAGIAGDGPDYSLGAQLTYAVH
jgi:hypothetical protein